MTERKTCTGKRQYRDMGDTGADMTCGNPAKFTSKDGEPRCGIHSDEAVARRADRAALDARARAARYPVK